MDEFLNSVKTVRIPSLDRDASLIQELTPRHDPKETQTKIDSPENALQVLRNQPSQDEVLSVINFLRASSLSRHGFNIKTPGPESAQILNVVVSRTIPDHWTGLEDSHAETGKKKSKESTGLIESLMSVAGVGALVSQIKAILREPSPPLPVIHDLLQVLQRVLEPLDFSYGIQSDLKELIQIPPKRQIIWKEFVSLIASGRTLSIASEAYLACKDDFAEAPWISNGSSYAEWLGKNICILIQKNDVSLKDVTEFYQRSLSLGYPDQIVDQLFSVLLLTERWERVNIFLRQLQHRHQTLFLEAVIRLLSRRYFATEQKKPVSGAARILRNLAVGSEVLEECLQESLTSMTGDGIRRAAIAAVAQDPARLQQVLEKSMQTFGDKLFIRHSPILQQEAAAKTILLAAGYVHRIIPSFLENLAKSGAFLNAVSNRLASSSTQSRSLGMVIGVAITRLVNPQKALNFDLDKDSRSYLSLTEIEDQVGSLKDLEPDSSIMKGQAGGPSKKTERRPRPSSRPEPSSSKIISIEEVSDSDGDAQDDGIPSYEKPDTDPEDSDDDPTLLQRKKPSTPVYIRDLLAGLRDSENYERYKLAINTSPSLIRRKIGFGTELTDNIDELALVLVGLQDKYDFERFEELRLQSMIAVLVAQPEQMGPWFARILFEGDLSVAQRAAIITTIGLAGREMAGFRDEDSKMMDLPALTETFPSKRLPERLHNTYSIEALTQKLSHKAIEPMALNAADRITGPDALKVRTFSSRMDVEKKRKQKARKIDAKILSQGFIFPLTGRFGVVLHSSTNASSNPFLASSFLVPLLQTLTLLLHTLGPSSGQDVTRECLALFLTVRNLTAADGPETLEALLSAFLAILEISCSGAAAAAAAAEERFVTDSAREITELREWAGGVFERSADEKVRMAAAAVMVRIAEVAERWERRLLGGAVEF